MDSSSEVAHPLSPSSYYHWFICHRVARNFVSEHHLMWKSKSDSRLTLLVMCSYIVCPCPYQGLCCLGKHCPYCEGLLLFTALRHVGSNSQAHCKMKVMRIQSYSPASYTQSRSSIAAKPWRKHCTFVKVKHTSYMAKVAYMTMNPSQFLK